MRKEGKHPLSKVPHLGDPELDRPPEIVPHSHVVSRCDKEDVESDMKAVAATVVETPVAETSDTPSASASATLSAEVEVTLENHSDTSTPTTTITSATTTSAVAGSDSINPLIIEAQRDGETDQEYLVRTCR